VKFAEGLWFKVCTLIFMYKLLKDYPIIAMHSRYAPLVSKEVPPRVSRGRFKAYHPLDTYSTGTWIGFNEEKLFVAVTDQNTIGLDKVYRSRGLLAMDVLTSFSSVHEALDYVKREIVKGYRRTNIILADLSNAYHVLYDERVEVEALSPGVHVFTNLTVKEWMDPSRVPSELLKYVKMREERALELASMIRPIGIEEVVEKLKVIASDHHHGLTRGSICYHDDRGLRYQSSSTIMAVSNKLQGSKILYCRGNPCRSRFIDYSHIISRGGLIGDI